MPIAIEAGERQRSRADAEMHQLLDHYQKSLTSRKRRPLEVDYYNWGEARPELVHPTVIEALIFVSQVEYPPEKYAQPILAAADRDKITSLRRFIEEIWLPEEIQHGVLLRKAAIVYGAVSEEKHDQDLAEIDLLNFPIGIGYSAGKAATFGETQELITKLFYAGMRNNTQDPLLREVIGDVEAQEMFHSVAGYKEFRKRFATPQDVIQAIREFMMPGHVTSPELQKESTRWAHELGFDFKKMRHVLATNIVEQAGYQGLGRVVSSKLIRSDAPPPLRAVLSVADRIHNPIINYLTGRIAAKVAGVKSKAI